MFQNKLLQWLIMILIAITLIVLAGFVLWDYMERKSLSPTAADAEAAVKMKKMSASEEKELTVEMKDILTNLANKEYVKINMAITLTNKKTKEEFEQLDFKARAIIIRTLADLTPEQISGSNGYDSLSTSLLNQMNGFLSQGKVRQVHITDIVLN